MGATFKRSADEEDDPRPECRRPGGNCNFVASSSSKYMAGTTQMISYQGKCTYCGAVASWSEKA